MPPHVLPAPWHKADGSLWLQAIAGAGKDFSRKPASSNEFCWPIDEHAAANYLGGAFAPQRRPTPRLRRTDSHHLRACATGPAIWGGHRSFHAAARAIVFDLKYRLNRRCG